MDAIPDPLLFDLLIVGQGLAGSIVASQALGRGLKVRIMDPGAAETASRVAGGILDPVSGQKFTPAWRGREFLNESTVFLEQLSQSIQARHSGRGNWRVAQGVHRVFVNPLAPEWFKKRDS
jgi:flavin-dependent dehydrogenase